MLTARRVTVGLAALMAGSLLVSACSGTPTADRVSSTDATTSTVATGQAMDAPVPTLAAETKLVNQNGQSLSLAGLRGKIVVIAPMLTFCQETCPMTSANMHQAAQDAIAAGLTNQVLFLEVTVDPARDTVQRLHAYTKLYGPLPNWQIATGTPSAVLAFWKAVGVSTSKSGDDTVRDWMTGKMVQHSYDVHHEDLVMIIGSSGRLRWMKIGRPDARTLTLPPAMKQFLDAEGIANLEHPSAGGSDTWTPGQVGAALRYVRQHPTAN